MKIDVISILVVDKEDEYLEISEFDDVTIWLKNGDCLSVEIREIRKDNLLVVDEDDKEETISFDSIKNIESN